MLATELRKEMQARRLTQSELAIALGVSKSAVSLWLSGDRRIPDIAIIALRAIPAKRKGAA